MNKNNNSYVCPYISFDIVTDTNILDNYIYPNMQINYHWSDDWSKELYIELAFAGFISISLNRPNQDMILLPELQFSYALLDWKNIHISKKIKTLFRNGTLSKNGHCLTVNKDINAVLDAIDCYHGKKNWMSGHYAKLIKMLKTNTSQNQRRDFSIISVELWDSANYKNLLAGEIGYTIGRTYTSLSGFCCREKVNMKHLGKIQMLSLARLLEIKGYAFWNLGHPYMQYKKDLGVTVLSRKKFLKRWKPARLGKPKEKLECNKVQHYSCTDLLAPMCLL